MKHTGEHDHIHHDHTGHSAYAGEAETIRNIMDYLATVERWLMGLDTRFRHVEIEEFRHSQVLQEFACARLSRIVKDIRALLGLIASLESRAAGEGASISPQEMRLKLLAEHIDRLAGLLDISGQALPQEEWIVRLYEVATSEVDELNTLSKAVQSYIAHWLSADPERPGTVLPF